MKERVAEEIQTQKEKHGKKEKGETQKKENHVEET